MGGMAREGAGKQSDVEPTTNDREREEGADRQKLQGVWAAREGTRKGRDVEEARQKKRGSSRKTEVAQRVGGAGRCSGKLATQN